MQEKRVSIEVDEETRRKLKVLAAQQGVTIKEMVRYLAEQEWSRAEQATKL